MIRIRSYYISTAMLLLCCSCGEFRQADRVPRGWLAPDGDGARTDMYGAWAEVSLKGAVHADGELIAVSSDSIYLLPPSNAVIQPGPDQLFSITSIPNSSITRLDTWLTVGHRFRYAPNAIQQANAVARFPTGLPKNCAKLRAKATTYHPTHNPDH